LSLECEPASNGTGGKSIYGANFADENLTRPAPSETLNLLLHYSRAES
jgi:hypothetical protein